MLFPLEKPDFGVRFSTNYDYRRLGAIADKQCKEADAEYSQYKGESSEKERLKKVAQLLNMLCQHAWRWYAKVRNFNEYRNPYDEDRNWAMALRIMREAQKFCEEARQEAESLKRLDAELGRWWVDQIIKIKWDLKMKQDLCIMNPRSVVREHHAWQAKHPNK